MPGLGGEAGCGLAAGAAGLLADGDCRSGDGVDVAANVAGLTQAHGLHRHHGLRIAGIAPPDLASALMSTLGQVRLAELCVYDRQVVPHRGVCAMATACINSSRASLYEPRLANSTARSLAAI